MRPPALYLLAALALTVLAAAPALADGPIVLTHGGAGTDRATQKDGTDAAASLGLARLKDGASPLDAAIAAVVALEDDGRYNAGIGANVRLDGKTVQKDAAVMDGATGGFGAVAALEGVRNPVLVARAVMDTPHILIVGDGAQRFARVKGIPEDFTISERAQARYGRLLETVKRTVAGETADVSAAWQRFDWQANWNFPTALKDVLGSPDTVGAVVRGADGTFAAAISTGGTSITFYGRVGDVPIYGAGIYAGPAGAVSATGNGEDIVKAFLSKAVYDRIAAGQHPQDAVDAAIAAFPKEVGIGLIAVGAKGYGGGANQGKAASYRDNMAWSVAGE